MAPVTSTFWPGRVSSLRMYRAGGRAKLDGVLSFAHLAGIRRRTALLSVDEHHRVRLARLRNDSGDGRIELDGIEDDVLEFR